MNQYLNFASAYSCYCIEGDEEGDEKSLVPTIYFESNKLHIIPDETLNKLQTQLSQEEEKDIYYDYNVRILTALDDVLDGECHRNNLYVIKYATVDWENYPELESIDLYKDRFMDNVLKPMDEFLDAGKIYFEMNMLPDSLCDHVVNLLNSVTDPDYNMTVSLMREDFENYRDKINAIKNKLTEYNKLIQDSPIRIKHAKDQIESYKQYLVDSTWTRIDRWFNSKGNFKPIINCKSAEEFFTINRYLLTYIFGPQVPNYAKSNWEIIPWKNELIYIVDILYDKELVPINYQLVNNNETLNKMSIICPENLLDVSIFVTWLTITGNCLSVRFTYLQN